MNPILKNVLAVVAGLVVGNIINMGIISIGSTIVPPPEGVNPQDIESIKANIHLYGFSHHIVPFLAHALGTLVGAYAAARIAASHHLRLAMIIGAFFLAGGIIMASMLGYPMPFSAIDILLAYLPMAWLGAFLAVRMNKIAQAA